MTKGILCLGHSPSAISDCATASHPEGFESMSYRVTTESRGGGTVYTMHDDATGASASVLPSFGLNLFDLRLPAAGEVRPVVAAAPDWADRPRSPARNGVPILFPYPNRVRAGLFRYGGKSYRL